MPKQIFQRPVPVRHDHWSKPKSDGVTIPKVKKRKPPKPLDSETPPVPLPKGADKPAG